MKFMKFFKDSKFKLYANGDSNWDLYTMQYKEEPVQLVAIAKDGTGAEDSCYGNFEYLERLKRSGINHGFIKV